MRDRFWWWTAGIIGAAVLCFTWLIWSMHQRDVHAPCEDFAAFPLQSVPARCLKHYGVTSAPVSSPAEPKK